MYYFLSYAFLLLSGNNYPVDCLVFIRIISSQCFYPDKFFNRWLCHSNSCNVYRREFEVPSLNFAGQMHKWRLSGLLQKGCERSHATLLDDLALALRFILVTARARLVSHFFSLAHAFTSLIAGTLKLLGERHLILLAFEILTK